MININFENPVISEENILQITTSEIDNLYSILTETDQFNLFFVLLTTMDEYEKKDKIEAAAHVAYLLSYYLFVALTPPGSEQLALRYAEKAIEMNPVAIHKNWKKIVINGN